MGGDPGGIKVDDRNREGLGGLAMVLLGFRLGAHVRN